MNNKSTLNIEGGIGMAMWGRYRVQVFDPVKKEITADYGWHKNLILNSGMDAIARSCSLADCNLVGICGTGSRPNIIPGGTSEITQSGAQIYLNVVTGLPDFTSSYSTYSGSAHTGDVIVDSEGSQSVIRAVIGGRNLYVDNSASYSTGRTFNIFQTSQSRMEGEVSRSVVYLAGSSSAGGFNCGTQVSESQVTMRRTYDFPLVTTPAGLILTEGGTSWISTAKNQVFSRYVFPYAVSVPSGSQLRMTHDFVVRYGPITPRYITASVTGWPVLPSTTVYATESIQKFLYSSVSTTGGTTPEALDPSGFTWSPGASSGHLCNVFVSEDSQSLSLFGTASTRDNNASVPNAVDDAYTLGTYTRTKTATFSIYDVVSDIIYSIGFGHYSHSAPSDPVYGFDSTRQAFCVKYDQPQTKTNTQQLRVTFRFSWNRVLDQ